MGATEQLPGRLAWRSIRGEWYFFSTAASLLQLLVHLPLPRHGCADEGAEVGRPSSAASAASERDFGVIRLGAVPRDDARRPLSSEVWRRLLLSDEGLAAWAFEWLELDDSGGPAAEPAWGREERLLQQLSQWTTCERLLATVQSATVQAAAGQSAEPASVERLICEAEASRDAPSSPSLLAALASAHARVVAWELRETPASREWRACESAECELRRQRAKRLLESLPVPVAGEPGVGGSIEQSAAEPGWRELLRRMARLESLETDFEERLRHAKLSALRELAYGASHEINNPLANIASRAQLLLRDEADPQRRRALASIHGQAMRAHEMIADMMLFAKPPRPVLRRLHLGETLLAWGQRMSREMPATIEFRCEPASECVVELDPDQACVAWDAMVRNAVEAMAGNGRLVVRTELVNAGGPAEVGRGEATEVGRGWVWVVFEDQGPGLSLRAQEHLFDPFFSAREAGRGLGFGLSKAWRIAELHGGAMQVEATGEGVAVRWGLPCN